MEGGCHRNPATNLSGKSPAGIIEEGASMRHAVRELIFAVLSSVARASEAPVHARMADRVGVRACVRERMG